MRVGFIGLGSMGLPMAQRIQDEGHDLVVWARRSASLTPFADTKAVVAASPADLGAQVETVGLCVFDAADVDHVLFGPDGIAETLAAGSVVMVHSTVAPVEAVELAAKIRAAGFRMVEAPVSGGSGRARAGQLTIMVGGDAESIRTVSSVLDAVSSHVVHLGDVGSAARAKLINNTLFTAQVVLADWALALGETLGLSPAELKETLSSSRSACVASQRRFQEESLAGIAGSVTDHALMKDIALLARELGPERSSELLKITEPFAVAMRSAPGVR
jgi:3-hydroxyisobutyrate dehydrogenase-like beta-hydroxyacid dehydrogenase